MDATPVTESRPFPLSEFVTHGSRPTYWLLLPRDAMLARYVVVVCVSVCLSVTSRYCIETTERIELVWGMDSGVATGGHRFFCTNSRFLPQPQTQPPIVIIRLPVSSLLELQTAYTWFLMPWYVTIPPLFIDSCWAIRGLWGRGSASNPTWVLLSLNPLFGAPLLPNPGYTTVYDPGRSHIPNSISIGSSVLAQTHTTLHWQQ